MTNEEIAHVHRLLNETKKRYNALEVQAAIYGAAHVPSHIATEMKEAEESMERLNAKLRIVTVPVNVQQATGPEASIDVLRLKFHDMQDQVQTMWRYLENMILEDRGSDERWRTFQTEARKRGVIERRAVEVVLAIGVGIAIYLALHY